MVASNHRDIGINHNLFARRLDAHVSNGRGWRPNKDDSLLLALFSKLDILGQESIPIDKEISASAKSSVLLTQGGQLHTLRRWLPQ